MGGGHGKLLAFVMSFSYFNCPHKTFISTRRINGVGVERCGKTRQVEMKADTVWGGLCVGGSVSKRAASIQGRKGNHSVHYPACSVIRSFQSSEG